MVSHKSINDKSPQVSRTLLSILVDLNYAIVWVVSTCTLISKSFSLFTNPLGIVSSATTMFGITVTSMFHIFLVLYYGQDTYLSFCFLLFLFCGLLERQSPLFAKFSFFVDYH